ncbi:FtsX-like permease family protein [Dyadobacter flavalbus]|uniref:FtsX-like permease family protein n=1 Tax=Dyadobacter flavalbus TaxID=2579942 RepID=A0A5M8QPN6_9BACT|nr:FtsX-like permease family protein [Dyadobacter flavalbus]KAA6436990.1 FtsX-like permease family protein [Dyadobacter flavalbus]
MKKFDPSYEMDNFSWLSARNETFIKLKNAEQAARTERQIRVNGKKYYGEIAKYYNHKLQPLSEVHFDERYDGKIRRSILWILAGVGGFLLLIACINFVNLATAQALKRSREIGVRKVLGGTRSQLFWQFMLETAILTMCSALLAFAFSAVFLPLLNDWTNTHAFNIEVLFQPGLLLFWFLTMSMVMMAAGFYPAVIISGFNPVIALKNKTGMQQSGSFGLRRSLIAFQLIIAQILVIGTLVLVLQLNFFRNADPGFNQNAVITIPLPASDSTQQVRSLLKNSLLHFPDIKTVSYQYEAPMSTMGYGGSVRFDNRADWEKFMISDRFGDESYLDTYKIPLLAGRNFIIRDSVTEFLVNRELMQKAGIRNPEHMIGKQFVDGNSGLEGKIVGVVNNFHLKSLQEEIKPCALFHHPKLYKEVAVRLDTEDFSRSILRIQNAWQKIYPEEVFTYQFVDEKIEKFYEKEDQLATLIRSFAMIAILICCLGLYGMISFMVTHKTKEIGVRKVLGAGVNNIILLFGKEFLILVSTAFIIAAPIAWYVMKNWLDGFAYRIHFHWWILASGGIIILSVTFLTVGFKVIKAAWMNPVKSLATD